MAGARGYDPARRVVGRKRHALTDTDGRLLVAAVSPADLHDSHGGVALLRASRGVWPFLAHCFADRAYRGDRIGSAGTEPPLSTPTGHSNRHHRTTAWGQKLVRRHFSLNPKIPAPRQTCMPRARPTREGSGRVAKRKIMAGMGQHHWPSRIGEPVRIQPHDASHVLPKSNFWEAADSRFSAKCLRNNGAARGIRTPDPLITNEVLYQLSYCGADRPARPAVSGALIPAERWLGKAPHEPRRTPKWDSGNLMARRTQRAIAQARQCRYWKSRRSLINRQLPELAQDRDGTRRTSRLPSCARAGHLEGRP